MNQNTRDWIDRLLAEATPLSPERRARLAAILKEPGGRQHVTVCESEEAAKPGAVPPR